MRPLTIQATTVLQPFVRHIEVYEQDGESSILAPLPFYADGCPGLIFHQTQNGMMINNTTHLLQEFFVYGQTVQPIEFAPQGAYRMIVFYFYPHVIKSLYGINSREITDTCLDLGTIRNANLHEIMDRLLHAPTAARQVELMSSYLAKVILKEDLKVDKAVNYAINHIIHNNGQTSLKELRAYLQVSERTFERKFEHHVGVNAKLFARICQFRASLAQLHNKDFSKLSDLAYDNGYSDQSHFIRSFREFTGYSPLDYKRQIIVSVAEGVNFLLPTSRPYRDGNTFVAAHATHPTSLTGRNTYLHDRH